MESIKSSFWIIASPWNTVSGDLSQDSTGNIVLRTCVDIDCTLTVGLLAAWDLVKSIPCRVA